MTSHRFGERVSRRAAVAGFGATGIGLAFATVPGKASAQEATPEAMANHPMVGAWVVDRNPDDPTELPTTNVFHSDGTLTDATVGAAGAWEATGPRTANFTLLVIFEENGGSYVLVRGFIEVDESGDTAAITAAGTVVAPDGTVIATDEPFPVHYTRIRVEPIEAAGTPFDGFPAWTPPATPTP